MWPRTKEQPNLMFKRNHSATSIRQVATDNGNQFSPLLLNVDIFALLLKQ
jgi:hypothetical protein